MRDDDDLTDYDLGAWDVPPPGPGLADAVIARAKQPAGVGAAEDPIGKPVRRWWIGVVAAGVAATLAVGLWGLQRAPQDGGGDIVAAHAQLVELGPSSVQLDPGAEMHWRRDKHRVTVAQPRGVASWTIRGDDTFVIDAGAMVASVEASGASLRVEVKMNVSDARVIGASALTAAVVAMVTVVVYEGRVKVASGGQIVTALPGTTLELKNPALTPPPIAVGAATDQQLAEMDRQIAELRRELAEARQKRTVDPLPCDEVSCVLNNYEGECCLKFKKTPKSQPAVAACDAEALRSKGQDALQIGMDATALAKFEAAIACRPGPELERLAFMAACRSKNADSARRHFARLPPATSTGLLQICVRNGITLPDEPEADIGTLRIQSTPRAKVFVDGLAVGTTPAVLQVVAGKHKITFQLGDDKFTFAATVEAGKTATITKDLR